MTETEMGSLIGQVDTFLEVIENGDTIDRIARVIRKLYKSLIVAGFNGEEALKIIQGMKFNK